jgi:hypothetical protein
MLVSDSDSCVAGEGMTRLLHHHGAATPHHPTPPPVLVPEARERSVFPRVVAPPVPVTGRRFSRGVVTVGD